MTDNTRIPPDIALSRLLDGNERFATGAMSNASRCDAASRQAVAAAQRPFAAVLTCADSRVPPDHIFDAGLGELFVCRNAGNLLDELTVGSLEYAVLHCGTSLVCITGHTGCGAVNAAVAWSRNPEETESHNIDDVMRRLAPAVAATPRPEGDDAAWADAIATKNVTMMCRQLVRRSPLLTEMTEQGTVAVVGLMYDLASGRVEVITPPST